MSVLASARRRVTQPDLEAWAALSGDHNPLHTDRAYAATTPFGEPIVFGHLILTWMTSLAGGLTRDGSLDGASITALRFRAPVFAERDYRVLAIDDDSGVVRLEVREVAEERLCSEAVLELSPAGRTEG